MKRWALKILLLCIAQFMVTGLAAQEESLDEQLKRAGELAQEERFSEAIPIWHGALDSLSGEELAMTEMKLGIAFQQTGGWLEAWYFLSLYLASDWGKGDTAADGWLQEVETTLAQTHVKVSLTCDSADAVLHLPTPQPTSFPVFRPCPLVWWFTPGKHGIRASAPGHKPRTIEIDVHELGDSGRREVRLAAVVPDRPPGTTIVKPVEPKKPSRALEWALIGSGLALGVTGGIFHGIGYSKNEALDKKYLNEANCPCGPEAKKAYDAEFDDEVRPKQIGAYVLYGVGGAAFLAGVVTWAIRKPGQSKEPTSSIVSPIALPGGGGGAMVTLEF